MTATDFRRRLLAILAADAVGYSRLMSIDEGATVTALDGARVVFRRLIDANQGGLSTRQATRFWQCSRRRRAP
jgi:adenylate cyclase